MNALYNKGRQKFLEGSIHWLDDTIKAQFIDTDDYEVDLSADEFLSDIPSAARVGSAQELTDKTSTNGVADAGDTSFPSLTGDSVEALVLYRVGSGEGDSPLIAYIDSASGLAFTPNGGGVVIVWSEATSRLFKL